MESRIYLNDGWKFVTQFEEELNKADYDDRKLEEVRIPHTVKELPFHYFDESEYQMLCGYRRILKLDSSLENKTLLLTFDGVAHDCEVFINGEKLAEHHCGYTAFTVDITDKVKLLEDNLLVVKVDSRESLNIPPFGYVIDYMTYGGIYRDVYLEVKNNSYIEDAFVTTKITRGGEKSATISEIKIVNPKDGLKLRQWIKKCNDADYSLLEEAAQIEEMQDIYSLTQNTHKVDLWDVNSPNLYLIKTELIDSAGEVVDEKIVRFGYRKVKFKEDGFYLNGHKLKIRGLNRHQSFPYTGYAMPQSMQKRDADILKYELGLNAVRTSHYPQSHYFIDRCDEIGLLVFTEIPGWQHIGDEEWKNQAVKNVEEMVSQYRNHASIMLWGVRINESVDDDEFYTRTNEVAKKLDPSRQTGGVRCYKKSSLLEDVYTYNDFSHTGNNKGCDKKSSVTSDVKKPYLISEYNGHMYPCKPFDWEEHRREHAMRHANVLNDVAKASDIAGSFGWCMFDYNTHKDFGSGDRICYHGVMDMFRNPKMASYVYASLQDEIPVLEVSSSMDIGEHPGSNMGDIYIFTNADSVKMYKNDRFIKEYTAADSEYKALKHGPIRINDFIGDALEVGENMSHEKAEAIKELLNETARMGLYRLPKIMYLKAAGIVARYHMKMSDAVELFNKYIGNWGGSATSYRFEAYKDGEVVKTLNIKPVEKIGLKADIDHDVLKETNSYDVAAIRIAAVDDCDNVLHFSNDVVNISVEGPIELIGPNAIALSGGMGGTYVKTIGKTGKAKIKFATVTGQIAELELTVE